MGMVKFAKTGLIFYILASFVADHPIEQAAINERTQACSSGKWGCENGQCILFEKICNEEVNCSDGSDEAAKLCSANSLSPADGKCILPPYPDHGRYNASTGLKPGDVVSNISLTYSCDRGFSLKGNNSPACVNGTWLAEVPTCTIQCKPLKSTSVDFKCYKQNSTLEISCDLPQDNNSHAKATCKDSYYLETPLEDLICVEGSWDYMPHCVPECGTVAPDGETLIINGEDANINDFPWHVGLYDKTSSPVLQICGGSIFTPKLVITAAHCVCKDIAGLQPASSFAVAAGKLYHRWNTEDDEKYVQKIDVMKIEIPERYKGAINAFVADIAVLVLESSFVFSSFVRPVCIRLDSKENLNGQFGRVAGWGLTAEDGLPSKILQTVRLPLVSYLECYWNSPESFRTLITSDKICAGYTNGTALCKGDSGGGLVFSRQNSDQDLYYLYGIVSTSPRNEALSSCSAFAYTGFTNVMNHQEWLQDICLREWGCDNGGCIPLEKRCNGDIDYCTDRSDKTVEFCSAKKLSTTKMCVLPPYPLHGSYSATVGLKPGDVVSHTALTYSCDEGYNLKGEGSPSCVKGTWVADMPTCEYKICLNEANETGACVPYYLCNNTINTIGNEFIDKERDSPCASYLDVCCLQVNRVEQSRIPAPPLPESQTHLYPPCGHRNPDGVGFSMSSMMAWSSDETKFGEFPWTVAVLKESPIDGDEGAVELTVYVCAGSLIHPTVTLTAAHCVASNVQDKNVLVVRAGEWDPQTKKEPYPHQDRRVSSVEVHKDYYARRLFYDAALLFLEAPVNAAENIGTICLSPAAVTPIPEVRCFVSSWNKNKFGKEVQQKMELSVVGKPDCEDTLQKTSQGRNFNLHSSFMCACDAPGRDTCTGYEGSPLACPISGEGRYELTGISAWGISCGEMGNPGVYVDISMVRDWIDELMAYRNLTKSTYTY